MPNPQDSNPVETFEQSLDELEQLVERLEQGELSLDDSLRTFERGIALFRSCQGALDEARLRVERLLDASDPDSERAPFDPETP